MPNVTTYYRIYKTYGHHRQPRNTSPPPSSTVYSQGPVSQNPGDQYPPIYIPSILDGANQDPLIFWSVTDGTYGEVLPPRSDHLQSRHKSSDDHGVVFSRRGRRWKRVDGYHRRRLLGSAR
jgi:hypothetical protein